MVPSATTSGVGVTPHNNAATGVPLANIPKIHVSASDNEEVVAPHTSQSEHNGCKVDPVTAPLINTGELLTHVPPADAAGRTELTDAVDNPTKGAEPKKYKDDEQTTAVASVNKTNTTVQLHRPWLVAPISSAFVAYINCIHNW